MIGLAPSIVDKCAHSAPSKLEFDEYINTIRSILQPKYRNALPWLEWIRRCPPEHSYVTNGLKLIGAILRGENPPHRKRRESITSKPIGACSQDEILVRYREQIKLKSTYQLDFGRDNVLEEKNNVLKFFPVEETVARRILTADAISKLELWRPNSCDSHKVMVQKVFRALFGVLVYPESLVNTTLRNEFTWHIHHQKIVSKQPQTVEENKKRQDPRTIGNSLNSQFKSRNAKIKTQHQRDKDAVQEILERENAREALGLRCSHPNNAHHPLSTSKDRGNIHVQLFDADIKAQNERKRDIVNGARTVRERRMLEAQTSAPDSTGSNLARGFLLKHVASQLNGPDIVPSSLTVGWRRDVSPLPWPVNTDMGVTWAAPPYAPRVTNQASQLVAIMGGNSSQPPGLQGGKSWSKWQTSTKAMEPPKDGFTLHTGGHSKTERASLKMMASTAPGLALTPDSHSLAHTQFLVQEADRVQFSPTYPNPLFNSSSHFSVTKNHATPHAACEHTCPVEGDVMCSRALGSMKGTWLLNHPSADKGGLLMAAKGTIRAQPRCLANASTAATTAFNFSGGSRL